MRPTSGKNTLLLACLVVVALASTVGIAAEEAHIQSSSLVDLVVLLDVSRSMSFSDPNGLSIQTARFILDYLQKVSGNSQIAHIGLVRFMKDAEAPLLFLQEPAQVDVEMLSKEIGRTVDGRPVSGGTHFITGLKAASALFSDRPSENQRVIVLITDGEPNAGGKPTVPEETGRDELSTEIHPWITQDFGRDPRVDELHVILVGDKDAYVDFWGEELPQEELRLRYAFTKVVDSGDLFHVYKSVARLAGRDPRFVIEASAEGTVVSLETGERRQAFVVYRVLAVIFVGLQSQRFRKCPGCTESRGG